MLRVKSRKFLIPGGLAIVIFIVLSSVVMFHNSTNNDSVPINEKVSTSKNAGQNKAQTAQTSSTQGAIDANSNKKPAGKPSSNTNATVASAGSTPVIPASQPTSHTTASAAAPTTQITPSVTFSTVDVHMNQNTDGSCDFWFTTNATSNTTFDVYFDLTINLISNPQGGQVDQTEFHDLPDPNRHLFNQAGSVAIASNQYNFIPGATYSMFFDYQDVHAPNHPIKGNTGYFAVPDGCSAN